MKTFFSKNSLKYGSIAVGIAFCSFAAFKPAPKPSVILIGDSTVKNGRDDGQNLGTQGQWGWGHYVGDLFDTTKVTIVNRAVGGTSSRTFQNDGQWERTLPLIKAGDYVLMQFGHNDGGKPDDPARARATLNGNGEDTLGIENPLKHKHEIVHTYGWYMRKYIEDIKAKGAIPVVCSLIPRNDWTNGKVNRSVDSYAQWAEAAAKQEKVPFIPLNTIICDNYDKAGETFVRANYFLADHTHTIMAGAKVNAQCVVDGIKSVKELKPLAKMLK